MLECQIFVTCEHHSMHNDAVISKVHYLAVHPVINDLTAKNTKHLAVSNFTVSKYLTVSHKTA